jgi:hypothetical protein
LTKLRTGNWVTWILACAIFALAGGACGKASEQGKTGAGERSRMAMFMKTPYPRICMFWSPVRGDRSLSGYVRHDLIVTSTDWIGLEPDREPRGLADGFTPESVEAAKRKLAEVRELNPDVVLLCELNFYEYYDQALPEDHPWWLRVNGEREQFWPGTHRMDWYNPDYRAHIVRQTEALKAAGVDGVYYDNLREEPQPWIAMLTAVREKVGDDFLVLANAGYAIDEYDFAAPYLNGMMYESGFSHGRTEWDDTVRKMQHTQSLLRYPRISCIERFEDIEGSDEGPLPKRRTPAQRDPAARRWSMCYALTVGDFYYLFSDNTYHGHDWYPEYDAKIGLPVEEGKRVSEHVWRRQYDKGLVVVNLPGGKGDYEVKLKQRARDSFTGEEGATFTVKPGDGRILVWAE